MLVHLKAHTQQFLNQSYIGQQYQQIGLEPKGIHGYLQEFQVNDGKQIDSSTQLKVDGRLLELQADYIPLAFSAQAQWKGEAAMALNENRQPWFRDLKELLEDHKDDPRFNLGNEIRKLANTAFKKGAVAYFVYNSSTIPDHLRFNNHDTIATASIPVIYITTKGLQNSFHDRSATLAIEARTSFFTRSYRVKNLLGFINHHAAATVLLCTSAVRNDDGTNTAALIEIARLLKKSTTTNYNYLVLHSSGTGNTNGENEQWVKQLNLSVAPACVIRLVKKPTRDGFINYEAEKDRVRQVYDLLLSTDIQGKLPATQMEF